MMKKQTVITILLVIFSILLCEAAGDEVLLKLGNTSKGERDLISFAFDMYNKGEYYRAITEFMRFNSHYAGSILTGKSELLIAESYCNAEEWDDAIKVYKDYILKYPDDLLISDAEYRLLYSYIQKGEYDKAEELNVSIANSNKQHKWKDEIEYINMLTLISKKKWRDTIDFINNGLKDGQTSKFDEKYRDILNEVEGYTSIPRKSPKRAGVYSAVLPGLGQLYAKKPGDGFMALLLTGVSLATALNCHVNNADFGTLVFGVLTLSFYSANIYNAMNNAIRFNEESNRKFYLKIADFSKEKRIFWSFGVEFNKNTGNLILRYKY